jgi:hypothetical protein
MYFNRRYPEFVINSVVRLATDPQPLPQQVLHTVRSSASSFDIQYPLFSFTSFMSCLHLLLLPRPANLSFPLSFLQSHVLEGNSNIRCDQSSYPSFLLYVGYSSPTCLYVILFHYSHDRSNWSSPSFSSTTFQNFPGIYDILPEVSKFQHHTRLCSKRSTLLVSSLIVCPISNDYLIIINKITCATRSRALELCSAVTVFTHCFNPQEVWQLSLVHTYAHRTRTKSGNVRTLSPYCTHFFFPPRGQGVCSLQAWMKNNRQSLQVWTRSLTIRAHSYFLQCVISLSAEFERLTCRRKNAVLISLRICSPTRVYGMFVVRITKTVIRKVTRLIYGKNVWSQYCWS